MTGTNLTVTTGSLDGMLGTALLRISRLQRRFSRV